MSDFIERQKAVDAVLDLSEKLKNEMLFIDAIVDEIENIPSAEPERKTGEWIPVSEKLPWTDTDVLVTVLDDSGDTPWSYTAKGWLTPDGQYWVVGGEICYGVIAWMPLPEPYQAEMNK